MFSTANWSNTKNDSTATIYTSAYVKVQITFKLQNASHEPDLYDITFFIYFKCKAYYGEFML